MSNYAQGGATAAAKRLLDVAVSACGLLLLSPLLLLLALWIKLDSSGPVFFRQTRCGKDFRPFSLCKFRTMVADAERLKGPLTHGAADSRITRAGRFLRRTKLDELPQLLNVLKGDMSLVGPRPEVPRYVELFHPDYERLLRVRPGITDLASLKYIEEERILGAAADPEQIYIRQVLPEKIRLSQSYLDRASFWSDMIIILRTLVRSRTAE